MNVQKMCTILLGVCFLVSAPFASSAQQNTSSKTADQKSFLGVRVGPLTDRVRSLNGITAENGVVVKHVMPETPAARAGLKSLDVIRALNQSPITSVAKLRQHISSRSPGDHIALKVHRSGEDITMSIILASHKNPQGDKSISGGPDQGKRETMKKLLKKMGEMENKEHSAAGEQDRSARTPGELREKMKSFLENNGIESTGTKNDESDEDTSSNEQPGEFQRLYQKLKKSLPKDVVERLNPEHLRTLTEKTKEWVRETSAEDVKKNVTRLLDELKDRVRSWDGQNVEEVKQWKKSIQKGLRNQMETFEEKMENRLNRFEDRMTKQMKRYNSQLQEQIEQLQKLRDEQERGNDSNEDDRANESSNVKPYLGIRPSEAPSGSGIVVRKVKENSPASRAGLQKGDVLRKMNGTSIKSVQALQKQFYQVRPGDKISLLVERNGWTKEMKIEVGRRSESSDSRSSGNGEKEDRGTSSSLDEGKFFQSRIMNDGREAFWMLEMMTDYKHGRYFSLMTNGVRKGIQMLKQQLKEQPLRIEGRIRLTDQESGEVLFSWPLHGDLSEAVSRFERLVEPFLKQTALKPSESDHTDF